MTGRRGRGLSMDDRILWGRVARSAEPLPGKRFDPDWNEPEQAPAPPAEAPAQPPRPGRRAASPELNVPPPPATRRLDAPLRDKLKKGRLPIEGKIDLHGLSQGEAHGLLLSFLHRAHAEGRRHLLVVTGKGSSAGSEGVLRRVVPAWFATPAFRGLVHSHSDAARHHGGSGALYVMLRKRG